MDASQQSLSFLSMTDLIEDLVLTEVKLKYKFG